MGSFERFARRTNGDAIVVVVVVCGVIGMSVQIILLIVHLKWLCVSVLFVCVCCFCACVCECVYVCLCMFCVCAVLIVCARVREYEDIISVCLLPSCCICLVCERVCRELIPFDVTVEALNLLSVSGPNRSVQRSPPGLRVNGDDGSSEALCMPMFTLR